MLPQQGPLAPQSRRAARESYAESGEKTEMRRILLAATLTFALAAGATTATAQGFSGPWEAGHEPPPITNPGVTVGAVSLIAGNPPDELDITISPSLWCPNTTLIPLTVTVSDPSGKNSVTAALGEGIGKCQESPWEWTKGETASEVLLVGSAGTVWPIFVGAIGAKNTNASVSWEPFLSATTPFFYEVSGPSGVIAQAAMTVTVRDVGTEETSTKVHDITACERKHLDIISGPGGEEYCWESGSSTKTETVFSQGGWPAPAPPKPEPQPEPAPTYPALTRATAGHWVKIAVEFHFLYVPTQFRATHCVKRAVGRYHCDVSWRHGSYTFAGTVEVGSLNTHTAKYTYGFRVVRTDVRTHQRRTFTSAY